MTTYIKAGWKRPPEPEGFYRFGLVQTMRERYRVAIESGHSWGCASAFARRTRSVTLARHCLCSLRPHDQHARGPI